MRTLKVSLTATVIGTGAWMFGLPRKMWPAHPQWCIFLLTLGLTFLLLYAWPAPAKK